MNQPQSGRGQAMKILVPTDFTACSEAAVEYAKFLAARLGADIDLLYVWNPRTEGVAGGRSLDFSRDAEGHFPSDDREGNVRVRSRVEFGELHSTLRRIVESEAIDLVVMGLHGNARVSHLFGYTARKVALNATCPVITVRASMTEDGDEVPRLPLGAG